MDVSQHPRVALTFLSSQCSAIISIRIYRMNIMSFRSRGYLRTHVCYVIINSLRVAAAICLGRMAKHVPGFAKKFSKLIFPVFNESKFILHRHLETEF